MSFIKGFPEAVTLEQMQNACAALGLPTRHLVALSVDVREGVTAVLHVANDAGQTLAHGGGPLLTEIRIPRSDQEVPDDAAADG
ncbi:hypothetical protein [Streptomyces jumonjinensis]|uniref:Uncharacterized protein n=1 Tax=Streptomyces jumonjinensis TaxID=1945 RepID=A0A646KP36_STRJU|nr:hypothetical protein [Streptomyces jumonjinensis]MQT03870.1 hypothetical protein [Streptomyces jumonjinensis]